MSIEGITSGARVSGNEAEQRWDVLCVGEALAVTYPQDDLATSERPRLIVHTGGAESNVALHLATQGIRVAWASRLGSDPFGRKVMADLSRGGVDVSAVRIDDRYPTGMYLKDTRPDGGSRMHYYRINSAASHMEAGDVAFFPLDSVRWVHVSGITAAISATAAAMVEALIEACRARGVGVSFDVNFRPRLWPVETAAAHLLGLAQRADIVFVGRDEAEELWGAATAHETIALLSGPDIVVVKDGDIGATEVDRRGHQPVMTFQATPPADVVEVIGAGDAFAGGYLAGLIREEDASERLLRGHASAAWTIGSWDDVRPGHEPAPFQPAPHGSAR